MPGSTGQPDGGGGGGPAAGGGDPSPRPAPPGAEEAAPRPPPEPDDAAAALRLALDQLSALGLGAAGRPDPDPDPDADPAGAGAAGGEAEPAPPDGPEPGAPLAPPPGALPLLEPAASPPPAPRPAPPDVFGFAPPHPAALGPPTLLAEQMSVIGSRKKSVNMTECVPVPSSEHVAEIVGRQGCKIKALRAKTNTYIKTPVRGEEPVFIVTGRREDVEMAKREILAAAEHFSLIRATRGKAGGLPGAAPGPPHLPGQTTIQVRVPYRVVGLVVGPKGATIKRIQQRTHTYIVTPGRDKEPVFAVTGMPENVDRAREEIEAHITLRTGAFADPGADSDFHANGTDVCLDLLGAAAGLWAKAPHPGPAPAPARRPAAPAPASTPRDGAPSGAEAFFAGRAPAAAAPAADPGPGPAAAFAPAAAAPAPEDCDFGFDFLALDLSVPAAAIWAPFEPAFNGAPAPSPRRSPPLPEPPALGLELPRARRGPDPWRPPPPPPPPPFAPEPERKPPAAAGTAAPGPAPPGPARECVVCADGEAMAALVPCGHNLFCMDCAVRICGRSEPECPACRTPATQAIHIFS